MTTGPQPYRRRDTGETVDAVLVSLFDFTHAEKLAGGDVGNRPGGGLVIATRGGGLPIRPGDYVVKDAAGTISVQSPGMFMLEHTPLTAPADGGPGSPIAHLARQLNDGQHWSDL